MLRSSLIVCLFALAACKKTETEDAGDAKAVDAATTVTLHIHDADVETVKLNCKTEGASASFPVEGKTVLVTGVVGPQCNLVFQPQGAKATGIEGGTTVDCRFTGDDTVACKAR
jgi:hypothetical protein